MTTIHTTFVSEYDIRKIIAQGAIVAGAMSPIEDTSYYTYNPYIQLDTVNAVMTIENLPRTINRIAAELNCEVRIVTNAYSGETWQASLHPYRDKLEKPTVDVSEIEDPDFLDKKAQELGFRTWNHIPNGAFDHPWPDPDASLQVMDNDFLNMQILLLTAMFQKLQSQITAGSQV